MPWAEGWRSFRSRCSWAQSPSDSLVVPFGAHYCLARWSCSSLWSTVTLSGRNRRQIEDSWPTRYRTLPSIASGSDLTTPAGSALLRSDADWPKIHFLYSVTAFVVQSEGTPTPNWLFDFAPGPSGESLIATQRATSSDSTQKQRPLGCCLNSTGHGRCRICSCIGQWSPPATRRSFFVLSHPRRTHLRPRHRYLSSASLHQE